MQRTLNNHNIHIPQLNILRMTCSIEKFCIENMYYYIETYSFSFLLFFTLSIIGIVILESQM